VPWLRRPIEDIVSAPQFAFTVFIIGFTLFMGMALAEGLIWLLTPLSEALTQAP
jgi:hypothetical protein